MADSPGKNAVIAAGLTLIATVAGFAVGHTYYKRTSTVQVNVFKGYEDSTGVLTLGFACLCERNPRTSISSWKGSGSGCGIDNGNALTLADGWIPADKRNPNIPRPDGACCKLKPHVGNWEPDIRNISNCWVSGN